MDQDIINIGSEIVTHREKLEKKKGYLEYPKLNDILCRAEHAFNALLNYKSQCVKMENQIRVHLLSLKTSAYSLKMELFAFAKKNKMFDGSENEELHELVESMAYYEMDSNEKIGSYIFQLKKFLSILQGMCMSDAQKYEAFIKRLNHIEFRLESRASPETVFNRLSLMWECYYSIRQILVDYDQEFDKSFKRQSFAEKLVTFDSSSSEVDEEEEDKDLRALTDKMSALSFGDDDDDDEKSNKEVFV